MGPAQEEREIANQEVRCEAYHAGDQVQAEESFRTQGHLHHRPQEIETQHIEEDMRNLKMRKHIGDDLEGLKHPGRRTIKRHHRGPFFGDEMQCDKDDDIDDQQMFDYSGQWHHKATGSGVSGLESFEYFFTAEGDKGLAA